MFLLDEFYFGFGEHFWGKCVMHFADWFARFESDAGRAAA